MVAGLIPMFKRDFDLTYQQASVLVLASSVASSVIQPLFGHYADRASVSWLLPVATLASIGGVIAAVVAPGYSWALVAVAASGIGVAAFHPQAARLVHFAGGTRLTTAMSWFSVGGGLGFAAAPLLFNVLVNESGIYGLLLLSGAAVGLAFLFGIDHGHHSALVQRHEAAHAAGSSLPPAQWKAFALLGVTIAVRSTVFFGIIGFLALYWANYLGRPIAEGNRAVGLVLGSSVVGTLIGGRLGDSFSRRGILQWGMLGSAGIFGLLAAASDPEIALALLFPAGILFALASSPLIVLGQQYLPGRVGVASGITIGLAVSSGGAAAPILGRAADCWGIEIIPWCLTGLALVSACLAFLLPEPARRVARSEEEDYAVE